MDDEQKSAAIGMAVTIAAANAMSVTSLPQTRHKNGCLYHSRYDPYCGNCRRSARAERQKVSQTVQADLLEKAEAKRKRKAERRLNG